MDAEQVVEMGVILGKFSASLPDIKSAINLGSGCSIKFEVPESEYQELTNIYGHGRTKELIVVVGVKEKSGQ